MRDTVKIRQVEMVVAIMRELGNQGITELTIDTYSPLMDICVDAANEIKEKVDALNIKRGESED